MVFVIGALGVALEVHVASLAMRCERDGSLVGNGGTEPFRYVAEECVAIVGAAIVKFLDPRSPWARKGTRLRGARG